MIQIIALLTDQQRLLRMNLCSPISINNTNYYYPLVKEPISSAFTSSALKWSLLQSQFSSVYQKMIIIGTNSDYLDSFVNTAYKLSGSGTIHKILLKDNFNLGDVQDALQQYQSQQVDAIVMPLISCNYNIKNITLQISANYSDFLSQFNDQLVLLFTQIVEEIFALTGASDQQVINKVTYSNQKINKGKFQIYSTIFNKLTSQFITNLPICPIELSGQQLINFNCFESISVQLALQSDQNNYDILATVIGSMLFSSQIQTLFLGINAFELQQILWAGQFLTSKSVFRQRNVDNDLNIYTELTIVQLSQYVQSTVYPHPQGENNILMGIQNVQNFQSEETYYNKTFFSSQFVSIKLIIIFRCFECKDIITANQDNMLHTTVTIDQMNLLAGYHIYVLFNSIFVEKVFYIGQIQKQNFLTYMYHTMQNFNFLSPEEVKVMICSQSDIEKVEKGDYGSIPKMDFKMALYNQGFRNQASISVFSQRNITKTQQIYTHIQIEQEQSYKIIIWEIDKLKFKFVTIDERIFKTRDYFVFALENETGIFRVMICPSYVNGAKIRDAQIGLSILYSQLCAMSDEFIIKKQLLLLIFWFTLSFGFVLISITVVTKRVTNKYKQ
ncbi:hypothetical protein SS50377_26524 [Spironucleus salmonicida]|uniref:Uncharacterized protein n=1 Tax=Spironucleus salmonicida TaxID=348837 RepID=V6LAE4_9EUKA|nr:hypothetical protein SS50377_26524 [Spironucleus salmonicida]|eukprot:EST41377.1 Hypothetical protein SS50377_19093 [Spironucleus salmonicida]